MSQLAYRSSPFFKAFLLLLLLFPPLFSKAQDTFIAKTESGKSCYIKACKTMVKFYLKDDPDPVVAAIKDINSEYVYLCHGEKIAVNNIQKISFRPYLPAAIYVLSTYYFLYVNALITANIYNLNCSAYSGCGDIPIVSLVTIPVLGLFLPLAVYDVVGKGQKVTIHFQDKLMLEVK